MVDAEPPCEVMLSGRLESLDDGLRELLLEGGDRVRGINHLPNLARALGARASLGVRGEADERTSGCRVVGRGPDFKAADRLAERRIARRISGAGSTSHAGSTCQTMGTTLAFALGLMATEVTPVAVRHRWTSSLVG